MTLTASGRLLLGTTTESTYLLDVNGTGRFSGVLHASGGRVNILGSNQNSIWLNENAGGTTTGYLIGRSYASDNANDFFIYNIATATRNFAIASTGAATFSSSVTALSTIVTSGAAGGYALFNYTSNAASRSWQIVSDAYNYGDFSIKQSTTQTGSTYADRLLINASGNVGIGTSTPSVLLHLAKASAANQLWLQSTTGTNAAYMNFINSGGNNYFGVDNSSGTGLFATGGAAYGFSMVTESAYPLLFGTNNTERMRITSGGNLLVGTTTDSGYKLSVSGTIYASGDITSGGTITFANNVVNYGGNTNYKGATGSGDVTLSNNGSALLITGPLQKNYGSSIKFVGNGSTSYDVDFLNAGFTTKTVRVIGSVHLDTTDSSFVVPRMTTAQRDALNANNKIAGAMIYNTSVGHFQGYNGSGWTNFW
jgi:hypothetical protein